MSDTSEIPIEIAEPLKRGKFIFEAIQEGLGEGKRTITFKPKLIIDYTIWAKNDPKTGKENYPEDVPVMGYATYDFGMEMNTPLDLEHNWLVNGYEGLSKDSELENILMYSIIYDLFHAFCHDPQDPNYSHYNWSLKGWLQHRASVKEPN